LTLSNIFRSATMQCESQAIANSGNNNVWNTTLSGSNDLSYSKTSFTQNENKLGVMNVLAVPQQLTYTTQLSVTYKVVEYEGKESTYTQTFNLYNYSPYVWESGHKITYTLTINTGAQLKASISDWKDVGYIEGVILPNESAN
ncbi:MAG: fimbrillin family protein, partial [Bacteroidia bacterium]|nr:fimbrillin family protein [Bacteroidia bacterium]